MIFIDVFDEVLMMVMPSNKHSLNVFGFFVGLQVKLINKNK